MPYRVKIRIVGLLVIVAALLGYFAGRLGAQQRTLVEVVLPDFSVWQKPFSFNGIQSERTVMKHHESQSCWMRFNAYYGYETWTPMPTEVCK
jgi:hypothetical protein